MLNILHEKNIGTIMLNILHEKNIGTIVKYSDHMIRVSNINLSYFLFKNDKAE